MQTKRREAREGRPENSGWVVEEKGAEGGLFIFCAENGEVYPFECKDIITPVVDLRPGQRVKFLLEGRNSDEEVGQIRRIADPPLKEWLEAVIAVSSQNGNSGWERGEVVRFYTRENPDKNGKFGYGFLRLEGGKEAFFLAKSLMRADIRDDEAFLERGMKLYCKLDPKAERPRALKVFSRV